MKITYLTAIAALLCCAVAPARAADDVLLQRLAICQDSWLDWQKSDPAQLQKLGRHIGAGFTHRDNDPFGVPKSPTSILGYPMSQIFPQSIGMAVGFSATVDAPFDKARAAVEKAVGKRLQHCEASDDMKTCDLELAPQRVVTIMAEDSPKATQTLVGCYYFYEK
ncbi:MAG TPA: hypothetical protein VL971_07930 [Rhizomicrobium sp.]|nr:hypothetical protein [Rhizomicrobium sp.]